MIVDSHCHAWTTWPYDTNVPDPASRGTIDQLLFEMENTSHHCIQEILARNYDDPEFYEVKYEDLVLDEQLVLFHSIFTFLGFPGEAMTVDELTAHRCRQMPVCANEESRALQARFQHLTLPNDDGKPHRAYPVLKPVK